VTLVLNFVRYGLPAAMTIAGIVLIAVGDEFVAGAGVVLIGIALVVFLMNLYVRLSMASEGDREREEAARRYYDRHGHWPDES
jgi:hypothetical protein